MRLLSPALEKFGSEVWLDEHELDIGAQLSQTIQQEINRVDVILLVISKNSLNSQWVNYELSLVLRRERLEKRRRLIPVLLDGNHVPAKIADRVVADFRRRESMDRDFRRLLRTLESYGEKSRLTRVEQLAHDMRIEHTIYSPVLGQFFRSREHRFSPGVGYYTSDSVDINPKAQPLVTTGDYVEFKQEIAVVFAMGYLFSVNSDIDGTLKRVVAEDTAWVEYGEPLFLLERTIGKD